jgi:hypothetical protein
VGTAPTLSAGSASANDIVSEVVRAARRSPWSNAKEEVSCWIPLKQQNKYPMTKEDAINKLQSLQRNDGGSNVHAEAGTVPCDSLMRSVIEIAREFRKIHELYPTVTPGCSKPSTGSRQKLARRLPVRSIPLCYPPDPLTEADLEIVVQKLSASLLRAVSLARLVICRSSAALTETCNRSISSRNTAL